MSRARKRQIQLKPDLGIPLLGFRISVFCQAHGISEDFYFRLQRDGLGPKTMKIGGVTIISVEAAEAWRRDREAATAANQPSAVSPRTADSTLGGTVRVAQVQSAVKQVRGDD